MPPRLPSRATWRAAALLAGLCGLAGARHRLAAQGMNPADPALAPTLGPGGYLDSLTVGDATYHHVRIRDVTVHSLFILHDGMIFASVPLSDLSPELQRAFGYSPAADAAARAAEAGQAARVSPVRSGASGGPHPVSLAGAPNPNQGGFEGVLRLFGHPPELRSEVDLRSRLNELGLFVKDQGRRPSCAIFAVVSALEYQYAVLVGRPEKLSEEYVTWATRKVLGRGQPEASGGALADGDDDLGFSIEDVVLGVRTYGVPSEESMPDRRDRGMSQIAEPDPSLIDEARGHCAVAVYRIPGRDATERIGNMVSALNEGIPVVVGMPWPNYQVIRSGYLDQQPPLPVALGGGRHAVTLVGYRCPGQSLDQAVFIFKNSWGPQWGVAGYGEVTARYLQANPPQAVLLEVQRTAANQM